MHAHTPKFEMLSEAIYFCFCSSTVDHNYVNGFYRRWGGGGGREETVRDRGGRRKSKLVPMLTPAGEGTTAVFVTGGFSGASTLAKDGSTYRLLE